MVITSIDVFSAGKIMGVVYAFFGLLVGGFITLIAIAGAAMGQGVDAEVILGIGAIVLFPLLYGIGGFIGGALGAVVYNLAAKVIGGIQLGVDYGYLPPPQPAAPDTSSESPWV